ncbi:recombinase family protein [Streptomyces werraensis]|uniref:recombinase family protein n=1 Tax=Streptomyces werraensis TaxID=68284 RepID=UPI003417FE5F
MARKRAAKRHPLRPLRRVIIYIRVSMERDIMFSDKSQLDHGYSVANRLGCEVVDVVYDIDETGTTFDNRPILELVQRVADEEADGIVVLHTNRWGRNSEESQAHERLLRQAGGVLIAGGQIIDTSTAAGRMAFQFSTAVDENQSIVIGENWRRAHENRYKRELPHHGKPNFGYKRCPDCKRNPVNKRSYIYCTTCHGVFQPNNDGEFSKFEALAEVVRRYVYDDDSFEVIAKDMAARGIRSNPTKKYPNGCRMSATAWRSVLDTGFWAGLLRVDVDHSNPGPWNWEEWPAGKHKPVVQDDLETWRLYVAKREAQADPKRRSQKPKYFCSTMMRCYGRREDGSLCLASMSAGAANGFARFSCTVRTKLGKEACTGGSMRVRVVERKFLAWVNANGKGEEEAVRAMERASSVQDDQTQLLLKLEAQKAELERKLNAVADLVIDEVITRQAGKEKTKEYESDLAVLKRRIAIVGASVRRTKKPPAEAFRRFEEIWADMPPERQRKALQMVVDHFAVYPRPAGQRECVLEIVPAWAPLEQQIERRNDWGKLAEESKAA